MKMLNLEKIVYAETDQADPNSLHVWFESDQSKRFDDADAKEIIRVLKATDGYLWLD